MNLLHTEDCGEIKELVAAKWLGDNCPVGRKRRAFRELSKAVASRLGFDEKVLLELPVKERLEKLSDVSFELFRDPRDKENLGIVLGRPGPTRVEEICLLLLSACPDNLDRVRFDREFKFIKKEVELGPFEVVEDMATSLCDFTGRLCDHWPHVLHFSGHGDKSGRVILEDGALDCDQIATYVGEIGVLLVVLNACYTARDADLVAKRGPAVIANPHAVDDDAAVTFARHFYQAFARLRSIQSAFAFAVASLPEGNRPELIKGRNVDPAQPLL